MSVAKCRVPHIRKLDVALRARVHELIALCRMELCGSNDFRQLLHVDGLDIDDIWGIDCASEKPGHTSVRALTETLIADIEIPEVDS